MILLFSSRVMFSPDRRQVAAGCSGPAEGAAAEPLCGHARRGKHTLPHQRQSVISSLFIFL